GVSVEFGVPFSYSFAGPLARLMNERTDVPSATRYSWPCIRAASSGTLLILMLFFRFRTLICLAHPLLYLEHMLLPTKCHGGRVSVLSCHCLQLLSLLSVKNP